MSLFKSQMDYKKLPNFSRYRIYPDGRVWSEITNKYLKPRTNTQGYIYYRFVDDDKVRRHFFLHKAVASAYVPNPENKQQVDHIDRNNKNNDIANLRWVSPTENSLNKKAYGKIPYRYISELTAGRANSWHMALYKNKKMVYRKNIAKSKCTLEDFVKLRDEQCKIFGIEIDDKFDSIPDTCVSAPPA